MRFRTAAMIFTMGSVTLSAGRGVTLNSNVEAIRTAIDPSAGPPIADPNFPAKHLFRGLGPPGPYTPERAERLGVSGAAVIECSLALNGRLDKCTLIADDPPRFGFGFAALKMAQTGYLRAKPPAAFSDGDHVRVIVTFPVAGAYHF